MSIRNLKHLFRPRSVAVIGASNQADSVGAVLMRNLLQGGFAGPVMPVNPKYTAVAGVLTYPDVASLPLTPDLAVIATPPAAVPALIGELGARGTRAAIVLTAGLSQARDEADRPLTEAMLAAARPHTLRILGPNCIGLLVPGLGLNASFAHIDALPGKIAFVSQSGALCTAVLDWARAKGIGFSHFVSLGDSADVNFADVLDYLGSDPGTRAILLYIEAVREARRFMSAARGAARNKPVLAIKAGRMAEGAKAATSHTGALAGADDVYDAAIRRAGMLRVFEIDELFDAVETVARLRPLRGERLAILSNGGGPAVMATDALVAGGGRLAELGEDTVRQLDAVLPATWSRGNPVDIIGDADARRYAQSLEILLKAPDVDAVLVMHVPTAIAPGEAAAQAVAEAARRSERTVLASWMGDYAAERARAVLDAAGIPNFDTPDQAVRGFLHLVRYRRNQELLMETPPSVPSEFTPATATARLLVQQVLASGRDQLSEPEAKAVLAAYGIPIVETQIAASPEDTLRVAREIGFPVALKILSPDIIHKSDVGGVVLDIADEAALQAAAEAMQARLRAIFPEARLTGFAVQRMARRPGAHELIVGMSTDSVFGPIILFGQGGTAVEVIGDRAVGLPPLNMTLAGEIIQRTRVARLLRGYRDRPPADLDAIRLTLIQVSQLIVDLPEIVELDINPLIADEHGVLALDARIRIAPAAQPGPARLAIRPYPRELEESAVLRSGRQVLLRPIRPEDEPAHAAFISRLTPEDIRFRFFGLVSEFPHSEMARFTQNDYDREMAFIATAPDAHGQPETLGVVRSIADPDNQRAEFAIVVRSDLKGQGLGRILLDKMIRYCRARGLRELVGQVLADNTAMLGLARRFGFERHATPDPELVEVRLALE
ncbi:GNAT family N-acetyltransferase [Thermithiobacillus tepidarius DSM 3134]|uniref:bifunctional acetate--CoA ligase family protein/GNAT family N-acetyltransferase n=1 Tax=Thermithiobacillus tepidarius TaxID=929 RepID=UPI000405DB80|nr:GNAT family N-acetyltransferase [Thermithiobacillus tepidarius]